MEKRSLRQKISRRLGEFVSIYHRLRGCEIGANCRISKSAILDHAHPKGIHIGDNTRVLIEAMILAHDYSRAQLEGHCMWCDTYIGNNCVIGGRAMIMPGVHIGNHVYVAAGELVRELVFRLHNAIKLGADCADCTDFSFFFSRNPRNSCLKERITRVLGHAGGGNFSLNTRPLYSGR